MSMKHSNPYSALKQIFHEPNRLAIMSALVNAPDGIAFNDLKEECNLTDGNLSRHLQMLGKARVIRIKKCSFLATSRGLPSFSPIGTGKFSGISSSSRRSPAHGR